jgi:hypothetical protein
MNFPKILAELHAYMDLIDAAITDIERISQMHADRGTPATRVLKAKANPTITDMVGRAGSG